MSTSQKIDGAQDRPTVGRPRVLRFLIHPHNDRALMDAVTAVLDRAVVAHPDTFDHVVGQPAIADHYGYHDDTLSSVVLSEEPWSNYHRLTIRPGLHPVFAELLAIMLNGGA